MKTLSILNRKAVLSWFYLLIAIGLVLITLIPTPRTEVLFYNQIHTFNNGNGGSYSHDLGWPSFFLWVMAGLYFVHFIFGAFYRPSRYKEILQGYTGDNMVTDLSQFRGVIATILTWIIVFISNGDQFNSNAPLWWTLTGVWFLLNGILNLASRTGSLFKPSIVTVDKYAIAPWLYSDEPKNKRDYTNVYFYYPVEEDVEKWKKFIALGYTNSLLKARKEEPDIDNDADELTQSVLAEAQSR